jgi:hypothetical protein
MNSQQLFLVGREINVVNRQMGEKNEGSGGSLSDNGKFFIRPYGFR